MLKNSGASENTGIPLASHPRAQAQGEVEAAMASIRRQVQAYEDNGAAFIASAVETRRTVVQLRATAQRARAADRAGQDRAGLDAAKAYHQDHQAIEAARQARIDHALRLAADMTAEVGAAVRAILADAPASHGRMQ